MSEWQPIETAPFETPILIFAYEWKDGPTIICAAIKRKETKDWHSWVAIGATGYEWENDFEKPTHWMPLPSPPEPKP
jgi:hypothetical protein